ncbi:MAG: phosphate signaling complex protein PhoU [Clostridiales bacterium]|nr:phosphate signaling complex protein PhoU [Clostridiales bacterium]
MRSRFDEQLELLNTELVRMGSLCEEAIALAAKALMQGDAELAQRIKPIERDIDAKERDIENLSMKMLLHQQPVAKDLRSISSAMKMITDMERIGDQAADIGEIIGFLGDKRTDEFELICDMARASIGMVTKSIDAFVKRDVEIAESVIKSDDIVDNTFTQVKKALTLMIKNNPDDGEYALDLLMIAKYFERIGDHAVNVAEWVEYSVSGIYKGEQSI